MRRGALGGLRGLAAGSALIALLAAGCATVPGERSYYDDIDSGGSSGGHGDAMGTGGGDGTVPNDAPAGPDVGADAAPDSPGAEDALAEAAEDSGDGGGPGTDAEPDTGGDGPVEAARDTGIGADAGADVGADVGPDAPAEAGCGPTDTVTNCGSCGAACDTTHSNPASCASGTSCTYSSSTPCKAGYADCDTATNTLDLNGCETPTNTANNCGGCGVACDTTHSNPAGCSSGTSCTYGTCKAGYADCDSATNSLDLNGCETPTTTAANCGGCGAACDTTHSNPTGCASGAACTYSAATPCKSGFADCDTASNALDLNGCETATNTATSCGGCGGCDTTHSNGAACSGGTACTYTSCKTNFADCDVGTNTLDLNGCEANLTSASSCGTCGNVCAGSCITHNNGLGAATSPYHDCNPLLSSGTVQATAQNMAFEACAAYTGNRSLCATNACAKPSWGPIVCSYGATSLTCVCWSYHGGNLGYVDVGFGPPVSPGFGNCFCPDPTLDGTWN
ncbi:MAG: hypothetical protein ACRENE_34500 [Polyangiaceae bacterium]